MTPQDDTNPLDGTGPPAGNAAQARLRSRALMAELARIEAAIARTLDSLADHAAVQGRGAQAVRLRRAAQDARTNSRRVRGYLAIVPSPGEDAVGSAPDHAQPGGA